jgi:hypothetical protein
MARCRVAARGISRRSGIGAATGDSEIATPYEIVRLSGAWALAVRRVGAAGERGRGAPRAQRVRQGRDRRLQLRAPGALLMPRALALAAGIAPGREHERGRGRRLRGEESALSEDDEAAIEEFAQFYATAGAGAAARAPAESGARSLGLSAGRGPAAASR